MNYLTTEEGMNKFNQSSMVLLKDEDQMYNTIIKNKYGASGVIKDK